MSIKSASADFIDLEEHVRGVYPERSEGLSINSATKDLVQLIIRFSYGIRYKTYVKIVSMTELEIKIFPDPVLRKKAKQVTRIGNDERKLAYGMIETMRSANGVGLAAPQIGITKRIIVVENVDNDNKVALVLINPKIIQKKGKISFCEGCLSVPGVSSEVVRPEFITLEALNLDGDILKINADGLLARIIQHETDHLDGVLFIDKIGFLKRRKIIKQFGAKVCVKF